MAMAYISGALTKTTGDVEQWLQFYEKIGALCESQGITAFVPHVELDYRNSCQDDLSEASPIFLAESSAIERSQIIIACLDDPSTGVGAELQLALNHNLAVIAFHQKSIRISRFIRGMLEQYSKAELLEYETVDALFDTLKAALIQHLKK